MKLRAIAIAIAIATALAAGSLLAAQPAVAATPPQPQVTFTATADIWGIEVRRALSDAPGMRLQIQVQGRLSDGSSGGPIAANGTATVTSGTHTFTYSYGTVVDAVGRSIFVVPLDSLRPGDPIDVTVTAQRPGSSDVATLTETGFDVVRAGVLRFSTDRPRLQQTCMSQKVWWLNGQQIEMVSYGDRKPDITSTITWYRNGKKVQSGPAALRLTDFEADTSVDQAYPRWSSTYYFSWNLHRHPGFKPGTYRWVITVKDNDSGRIFTAKHVSFRILPAGQRCGSGGGGI